MPLFDQILPNETSNVARVRDIATRLPLILLEPPRDDLAELLLRRTEEALSLAETHLAESQGAAWYDTLAGADQEGVSRLQHSMDRLQGSSRGPRERRWLEDAVDGRCVEIQRDAKAFWKSFDDHLGRFGNVTSRSLREAFEALRSGVRAAGTDRDVGLQDAQARLRELSTEEEGAQSHFVWLALGWLSSNVGGNWEAAEQTFFKGVLLRNPPSEIVEILLSRHLAHAHCQRKASAAALSAIQKAIGIHGDCGSHLDAARYGALADRPTEVRKNLDAAFAIDSLACIDALADSEVLVAGATVVHAVLAVQTQISDRLAVAREDQRAALERARQALARSGLEGEVAIGLGEAPISTKLGLYEAECALLELLERRSDAVSAVAGAIESAMKEKRQRVEDAQRRLDDAWNEREAAGSEALAAHQSVAEAARSKASEGLPDAVRLQQGCMWSLAIGCGGIAVYAVLAALLGVAGVAIGPDTVVGKMAIGLALAPLGFAAILQIVVASKQSALQAEMWREIERSRLAMEAAQQKVDAAYRAKLPSLRDELASAQAELKRLEDALDMLG